MKRLAEVRARTEDLIGVRMLGVLRAVVVGDGAAHPLRVAAEPAREGHAHLAGSLLRELGQSGVARLALDCDLEGLGAFPGDHGVGLPMTDPMAREDLRGALADRHPVGDMGLVMPAGVPPMLARAVGTYQERNEMSRLSIDPLVDRLMADGPIGMSPLKPAGDKLRGPTAADTVLDIAAESTVFKTWVSAAVLRSFVRALLGFVSEVIPSIHGRDVSPELS